MTSGTSAQPEPPERARRADARRNQERVLVAAEELFASEGMTVPVEDIAKRAGVGVGTIYRHFPDKSALLQAVVLAHLGKFVERAKLLSATNDACTALFTVLKELVEWAADKQDLKDELARAGLGPEDLHAPVKQELDDLLTSLVQKAQLSGAVRCDIGPADVRSLIMATCSATDDQGRSSAGRLVSVLCDGLRSVPPQR